MSNEYNGYLTTVVIEDSHPTFILLETLVDDQGELVEHEFSLNNLVIPKWAQ